MTDIQLSRLIGRSVRTIGDQPVGRLVDLTAVLSDGRANIHQLVIKRRRHAAAVVPWDRVRTWESRSVELASSTNDVDHHRIDGAARSTRAFLAKDEVLLVHDVLDSQVVDLASRRLARVSDVLLTGETTSLAVVAVDLGLGSLMRRMGLPQLSRALPPALVAWEDLHLVSGRGSSVQLSTNADGLRRLDPLTLAALIARLAPTPAVDVLRTVGATQSIAALGLSHEVHRRRLMRAMPFSEANRLIALAPEPLAHALGAVLEENDRFRRRFRRTAGWRVRGPVTQKP